MKITALSALIFAILTSCSSAPKVSRQVVPYIVKAKNYDLKFQGRINSFYIELDDTCKNVKGFQTENLVGHLVTEMVQSEALKEEKKKMKVV